MKYFVYTLDNNPSEINEKNKEELIGCRHFSDINDALKTYQNMCDKYQNLKDLHCYLGVESDTYCFDYVHMEHMPNGRMEHCLINDYKNHVEKQILEDVAMLKEKLNITWQFTSKWEGCFIPIKDTLDGYCKDKILDMKNCELVNIPVSAINEVFVVNKGWKSLESIHSNYEPVRKIKHPFVKQVNVNYISKTGVMSQMDIAPVDAIAMMSTMEKKYQIIALVDQRHHGHGTEVVSGKYPIEICSKDTLEEAMSALDNLDFPIVENCKKYIVNSKTKEIEFDNSLKRSRAKSR